MGRSKRNTWGQLKGIQGEDERGNTWGGLKGIHGG